MKDFLSSLFSKKSSAAHTSTPLESFVTSITMESIRKAYCTAASEDMRLPSAISVDVLYTANRIAGGMSNQIIEFQKPFGTKSRPFHYDAVLFEAASYCHAYLQYCGEHPRQSEDEEFDDDSPYSTALHYSCALTSSLVTEMMSPALPREALSKRALGYFLHFNRGLETAMTEFEWNLKYAISNGVPKKGQSQPPDLDLAVDMAVKSVIRVDHATILGSLVEVSRNLHKHGAEILKEWHQQHGKT